MHTQIEIGAILCYGVRLEHLDGEKEEDVRARLAGRQPEALGFTLVRYGSGDYTKYIFAATNSVHESDPDNPVDLGDMIRAVTGWREDLEKLCLHMGVTDEPRFWLLCNYP